MSQHTDRRPNILWICTDQQRYDTIHALNNPHIHTPNLDRLCAEGVAFTRAYCQSPICSPSRASFLTGLQPSTVGVNRNGLPRFPEKPHIELITKRLADAGYECGLSGKLHIASAWTGEEARTADGYRHYWYSHGPGQGVGRGNQYLDWLVRQGLDLHDVFTRHNEREDSYSIYRHNLDPRYHQTTWCADRAIGFITDMAAAPWLMSVNIFDPHGPFDVPAEYADRYDPDALPRPLFQESDLATQERLRGFFFQRKPTRPGQRQQRDKAAYYGSVELIDHNVGRMMAALEATGQRENTIVIFHSDHGEMLGDHGLTAKGCRFYEGAVRVPLIISWPGHLRQGLAADGLAALTDLAPTLTELTGIAPVSTHGSSLVPIMTGSAPPDRHHDYVRCEYYDTLNMHAPFEPEKHTPTYATMYRDDRYKLIVYHGGEYGELYDLEEDPEEFDNLWERSEAQTTKHDLIKRSFDASIVITDPGPPLIGRY
jgi:arylsulfatase A-like enzyme